MILFLHPPNLSKTWFAVGFASVVRWDWRPIKSWLRKISERIPTFGFTFKPSFLMKKMKWWQKSYFSQNHQCIVENTQIWWFHIQQVIHIILSFHIKFTKCYKLSICWLESIFLKIKCQQIYWIRLAIKVGNFAVERPLVRSPCKMDRNQQQSLNRDWTTKVCSFHCMMTVSVQEVKVWPIFNLSTVLNI